MRIGLVDLDTSHPNSWIPILRSLGHEVVAVFDGGTVHPEGYARTFAAERGIEQVYESPGAMAAEARLDLAIVHSCNWDLHVSRARPFVERGVGVLIDKPIAGNARDLAMFEAWERAGAKIAGGSSLRYCQEVKAWRSTHRVEEISYAVAGCGVDEFNYGIHAYALLCGLMGPGIDGVRWMGERGQQHLELVWNDGRRGVVGVGAAGGWLPFYATIATDHDVQSFQADSSLLYRSLLEDCLPYFEGAAPAPVPFAELIEAELAAVAAKRSRALGGAYVRLAELQSGEAEAGVGYDGAAFGTAYRRQRYGP